jgi:hypothetical protein
MLSSLRSSKTGFNKTHDGCFAECSSLYCESSAFAERVCKRRLGAIDTLAELQIEICAIARNRRNAPRCELPTPRPHTGGRKIAQRPLLWVGLNKLTPFELEAINFISVAAAGCLWEGVFQRRALGANERIALTLTKLWIAVSRVN